MTLKLVDVQGQRGLGRYRASLKKVVLRAQEAWLPNGAVSPVLVGVLVNMLERPRFPSPEQLWLLNYYRYTYMLLDAPLIVSTWPSEDTRGRMLDGTIRMYAEMIEEGAQLPEVSAAERAFGKRKKAKKKPPRAPALQAALIASARLTLLIARRNRALVSNAALSSAAAEIRKARKVAHCGINRRG